MSRNCVFTSIFATSLFLTMIFIFILFYNPSLFNCIFSNTNEIVTNYLWIYYRNLSTIGSTPLNLDKSVFERVCILPREVDPHYLAKKIFGEKANVKDSFGALMGWNDNNWHILLKSKETIIIVSLELFMFNGEIQCSDQIVVEFDKNIKGVNVISGKTRS